MLHLGDAGELAICINMRGWVPYMGMFLTHPLSYFSSEPKNLDWNNEPLYNKSPWQNEEFTLPQY